MVFPIVGGTQDTGYEIDNSLRFNEEDSAYLSKTWGSEGSKRTMTFSFWFKRGELGDERYNVYAAGADANNRDTIATMDESFDLILQRNDTTYYRLRTNRLFRDPSAWYHMVIAIDTTDGTASNRFKMYVNGVQETSFATSDYPTQNLDLYFNDDIAQYIGRFSTADSNHWDGHMADFYFIDGTQYAASDFGETNDNGVWIPKKFTGTFGSNGFKLEFKQTGTSANSSGIGADTSGNDNHFAVTNLAATDVTTDTPTNNFATFNFLHKASNVTLSEANCKAAIAGAGQSRSVTATIAVSKGKWYWETKYTTDVVSCFFGLVSADIAWNINANDYPSSGVSDNVGFNDGGTKYVNGTSSSYHSGGAGTVSDGDIVGCAANLDDNEVVFYVNGTALNSGTAISKTFSGDYFFVVQHQSSSGTSNFEVNFGNPTFSISSGNADANGYGNFEYAPPSGFYAVCTKNLAEYG